MTSFYDILDLSCSSCGDAFSISDLNITDFGNFCDKCDLSWGELGGEDSCYGDEIR